MSKKGHTAVRMCIGCRKRRTKGEMIRLSKSFEGVRLMNDKKNFNGRGYYLCPDQMCFKLAEKRNRWLQSIKSTDPLSSSIEGCLN